MNLKVYDAKDKLRETIDAMTYVQSKEELDELFEESIAELIIYRVELKRKLKK